MKTNWKWIVGLVLLVVLVALPLVWQSFMPYNGYYNMMRGYRMPMMNGYGMMAPFHGAMSIGMWLMWLIPLGIFILIGFAFAWAVQQFTNRRNDSQS